MQPFFPPLPLPLIWYVHLYFSQSKGFLWCAGKDLHKLALPTHLNEPLTDLQRRVEAFESCNLLDQASLEQALVFPALLHTTGGADLFASTCLCHVSAHKTSHTKSCMLMTLRRWLLETNPVSCMSLCIIHKSTILHHFLHRTGYRKLAEKHWMDMSLFRRPDPQHDILTNDRAESLMSRRRILSCLCRLLCCHPRAWRGCCMCARLPYPHTTRSNEMRSPSRTFRTPHSS